MLVFFQYFFQKGVGIRTARFNHSCCSNAEAIWNEEENVREIRAITRIYPGDEIRYFFSDAIYYFTFQVITNFSCCCENYFESVEN